MKSGGLIIFLFLSVSVTAQQLVMRGDYPDPSVIKIGDTYWATATTSNWAPVYPILKSKDLVNWTTVSHVFTKPPAWADYYFWAPELSYENGKVYLYYAAHKGGGNLCIAAAVADKPEGPYTDLGPLMCEQAGSIDAFAMRDEKGKLYMIWKEDGNSVNKPTPIWAMEMSEGRDKLIGEKKEMFRNNEPWEMNLVEGVSMARHGEYFYAFYAAAGCCGAACTYGVGIARSKSLLGPWEKYQKNPVLSHDKEWNCPGHGTPVEKNGKHYFLYHAYDKQSTVFTGREGLLIEYKITPDGWIEFLKDSSLAAVPLKNSFDGFDGKKLSNKWQWSVFQTPQYQLKGGELYLGPGLIGSFLGHKTFSANYTATVKLHVAKSTASPGLAIIGDEMNIIGAVYENGQMQLIQLKDGKETVLATKPVPQNKKVYLQVRVANGKDIIFYFGEDDDHLTQLNDTPVDGGYLPPWDRAVRVGLISKGVAAKVAKYAVFDSFELINK